MPPVAQEPLVVGDDYMPSAPDLTDIEYESHNVISQLREVTTGPSALTELLQDPAVLSALASPGSRKKKDRRGSSGTHRRDSRGSASVMSLVLAEEERQAQQLKTLLRSTGERLEHEMRRAEQAESRAEHAERRAVDATSRVIAAEQTRHSCELESARLQEEVKRYKLQLESMDRDVRRSQSEIATLTRQRDTAEEDSARARDNARKFQQALREHEAREEGREESRLLGMEKVFKNGRNEGWEAGRETGFAEGREEAWEAGRAEGFEAGRFDGFDEGKKVGKDEGRKIGREEGRRLGREEGFEEGRAQGRREERENAMHAFDRFLASEMNIQDDNPQERARKWSDSPYHIGLVPAGSSPPKPTWLRRRVHTDSPVSSIGESISLRNL